MPMVEARRRCPQGRFVAPDHGRYRAVSVRVFELLGAFTPLVEPLSVDEAFLDVAGLRRHYASPEDVAIAIRRTLREEVGLPASVGIAPTKFLAKLASEEAKPDGWFKVPAGQELAFLHPLPVRRLWGVGEATHASLEGIGVTTIGDVAALPAGVLQRRLGRAVGDHLVALAAGLDRRSVTVERPMKSISVEETFARDVSDESELTHELAALCDRLASRLRRSGRRGRTVTLKVRFADFATITRSLTVHAPLAGTGELSDAARALWGRIDRGGRAVRLLGVGVSALSAVDDSPGQLMLSIDGQSDTARVVDEIRTRFGDGAVRPARLAPGRAPHRDGDVG